MRKAEARVQSRLLRHVHRARELRAETCDLVQGFKPLVGPAEKAAGVFNWLRGNGVIVLAVMAVTLAIRRPRRIVALATRGWSLWQLYRNFRQRFDLLVERVGQGR